MPFVTSMTTKLTKRCVLAMGLFIVASGVYISGRETILHWDYVPAFVLLGIGIFGCGMAMITIPVIPEILEGIEHDKRYAGKYDEQILYNNMAGYAVVAQGIGESLGPTTSSLLEKEYMFRPTQLGLVIFLYAFILIYFLCCGRSEFFRSTCI